MSRISDLNYDILINQESEALSVYIDNLNPSSVFVLQDENTKQFCFPSLEEILKNVKYTSIEIPSGEQNKNLDSCEKIWQLLLEAGADRKSLLLVLGGGVLGDMGGFAASCYMRGIMFIQVPTTLLSQVDASVGSKLGINFHNHKNMIGLFNDPELVWINTAYLNTLSERHLKNGYAEIIKHALIQSASYWLQLKSIGTDIKNANWEALITESIKIKNQVVRSDKFESGKRKILNFGHTIGHAIESTSLESGTQLLHGEAIAMGMVCESFISYRKDLLNLQELEEIVKLIKGIFRDSIHFNMNPDYIVNYCQKDKKNNKGQILFSLLNGIGSAVYDQDTDENLIREALNYARQHEG